MESDDNYMKIKKKQKVRLLIPLTLLCLIELFILYKLCFPVHKDAVDETAILESIHASDAPLSVPSAEPLTLPEETLPIETEEEIPEPKSVSLMALGDNLMHMGVVYTGKQEDGTLNYDVLYEGVESFLEAADIKIINQETILGGNQLGFSGYPHFNSPTEVGDSLANVGFNVVLQSSNHTADQNVQGMENCIEFWKSHPEVLMVGLHAPYSEDTNPQDRIPILEIDGIKFAILNYTYGPNMGSVPTSIRGYFDILCNYDEKSGMLDFTTIHPEVLEDIKLADSLADVVIVCPHWGTEYATTPSTYQKEFAMQMTQAGADLIIGTHPHVVEPVEWITSENGNKSLCFYSLGNYVSTQKDPISMLEGMAWVTFDSTEQGFIINPDSSGVIPLVCQYTGGPVRISNVYLLENYTEELAASHGIRVYGGKTLRYDDLIKWEEEIFGDFVLPSSVALP